MSSMPKVIEMGSLWDSTKESILIAQKISKEEEKKKQEKRAEERKNSK